MDNQHTKGTAGSMTTLSECMDLAASRGYLAAFSIAPEGLHVSGIDRHFSADQVRVDNFYRFEGVSNPEDMSILYLIETSDGTKGTLVDAYGTYSDGLINDFMKAVEGIHKNTTI